MERRMVCHPSVARRNSGQCVCTLMPLRGACWNVLFTIASVLASAGVLFAQDEESGARNSPPTPSRWTSDALEPWPAVTETVASLPAAPDPMDDYLERGNVSFQFYDPKRFARRFQAETRFVAKYKTRVSFRWQLVRGDGSQRTLVVFPRFVRVSMDVTHQVLLPKRYAAEDMYSRALVQHELDHVRISADLAYQRLFAKRLKKELSRVEVQPESGVAFNVTAKRLVDAETERIFQDVMDLIRIRYRELDRVTQHGGKPIPMDFFQEETVDR